MTLPEIGPGFGWLLTIIAIFAGVLCGLHLNIYMTLVVGAAMIVTVMLFGPGELADIPYMMPIVGYVVGVIIGLISFAFQTDVIVLNFGADLDIFTVDPNR